MRLIDADALSERLYELYKDSVRDGRVREARWDAIEALEAQPTIEAEPVRHGMWIRKGNRNTCSRCGFFYYSAKADFNGCPNCRAKMDGDSNEPSEN